MADERKYGEDEVSEIFAIATTAGAANVPVTADEEGLTLEQLQDVGREVGLAPEQVADAAATLDARSEALPRRKLLGSPASVGRLVELPRAATDREWQFLVAELRETFGAKGEVTSHGDVREWTNGNLHAVLEQTEAGHRLRLGTYKDAAEVIPLGAVGLTMALIVIVMAARGLGIELLIPAVIAAAAGGALATNVLRLPRWAAEREQQMDHIAGRARALLEGPPLEKNPEKETES